MENTKEISSIELPNKENILLVNRINIFNFIFLIFLRIYFSKIFFFKTDMLLRNKKLLSLFEILGINWINYSYYNFEDVHAKRIEKSTLFCDKYSIYVSKNKDKEALI